MKKNVGNIDRIIRIVIGLVIIMLGIVYQNWWGALGIVPLLTAFMRFCPLYAPLGMNTCKKAETRG